ncbi:MAG: arsenite methyltransferase [Bacteroidales bacterium]|nr:arsenite methyltransferase [Bacteroidales bacterium]
MKNKIDIKDIVKSKYGEIAKQSKIDNAQSCCGVGGCCGEVDYTVFRESYDKEKGYNPEADLGLGCGIPTQYARISAGHSVLDLGSGAGNDCFVARALVGSEGKVVGLDFTDEMILKAKMNNSKLGYTNVRFVKGDIEEMPLESNQFEVVISNCVLNLVPDKSKAFSEIFRVLKTGGHFCVSDVVIKGELPDRLKNDVDMYAGCVSGAIDLNSYLGIIENQNFKGITIHKEKRIDIPQETLKKYLNKKELSVFNKENSGIYSVTISANK